MDLSIFFEHISPVLKEYLGCILSFFLVHVLHVLEPKNPLSNYTTYITNILSKCIYTITKPRAHYIPTTVRQLPPIHVNLIPVNLITYFVLIYIHFIYIWLWIRKKKFNLKTNSFCLSRQNYIVLLSGLEGLVNLFDLLPVIAVLNSFFLFFFFNIKRNYEISI